MMKVYISRDDYDDWVWLWIGPEKPKKIPNVDNLRIYHRKEMTDQCVPYTKKDFKTKFNISINKGTLKRVDLDDKLVLNEDYRIFSNDNKRKQ